MMELFSPRGSLLLTLFILLSVFCLVRGTIWFFVDAGQHRRRQLKGRLTRFSGGDTSQQEETLLKKVSQQESYLTKVFQEWRKHQQLQTLLLQANVKWGPGGFLLFTLLTGGVAGVLGYSKWGFAGGLVGAALGLLLPYKALVFKKKRRLTKFEKQLPDALDMLARGMKAGHSLPSGLQLVAKELPNPVGGEFAKTYLEYSHGLDLNSALLNLCQRVDLRDLGFFTTAVLIQRETGGNLTEILEKISSLIRERFKLRNQIKALTAEGRFSGLVLVLLPPLLVLLLYLINPRYEAQLVEHPVGRLMTGIALAFQIIGMLIIRKIVNIKV